jgi:predicted DNA-binding protein YlxM (UPF0122 family)
LSLAEIAEELGVSRNAVHDNIKRTEKLLASYEERLKLGEKDRKRQALYDKIRSISQDDLVLAVIEQLEKLDD